MEDLAELETLVKRGDSRDRAFADGVLRMRWARTRDERERAAMGELHGELRAAGLRGHAALRAEIASGATRGPALRRVFDGVALLERDHFVEEVLGVAYPPLDERAPEPELISYVPSGYDEIMHAFDATALGARDRFLDIGSGTGKVVLLAKLLTGAESAGLEHDAALVGIAARAAQELRLDGARFACGDARDAELVPADVVFMYLPFTGVTLERVMARIAEQRPRRLCAAALDARRHPDLVDAAPARSWLHVYAWR